MKKTKKILKGSIIASILLTCSQASDFDVMTSITATNNYVSRGLTQSNEKGAVFADVTLLYKDFYAGIWASNVEFEEADADSEIDIYIGYATSIKNFNIDTHYIRYYYPNSDDVLYYDEAVLDLSYTFDKLTLGAAYYLGTYTENNGTKLDYIEGYTSYDFDVLTAHASYGDYENIGENYSIGLTKTFPLSNNELSLDLTYSNFDADNNGAYKDENNLYATITYSF